MIDRCTVRQTWIAVLAAVGMSLLAGGTVRAQSADASGAQMPSGGGPLTDLDVPGAPPEPAVGGRNLFDALQKGGLLMVPLMVCSFIMLVFVFERVIALRRGRVIPAPFVKRFLHQLREGKLDRDQALDLCQESQSPVAEVFAGAVRKWGRSSVEVEQAIIDSGERMAHSLRRYLRLFNAIATISPLLGLLGTVFGMIRLFNEISTADAMGRTERLAGGISEALLTTAGGLSLAIPALCIYLLFVSRVDRLLIEIDSLGQQVVQLISAEALAEAKGGRSKTRPAA